MLEKGRLWWTWLCVCVTAASIQAQPDVRDVLRSADRATRSVRSAKFTVQTEGTGALAVTAMMWKGKVVVAGKAPDLRFVLRGRGRLPKFETTADLHFAWDGQMYSNLTGRDKRVWKGSNASALAGIARVYFDVWVTFTHPTPFKDELEAPVAVLEGNATVAQEPCHVVYVAYKPQADGRQARARWYFSARDLLPRRVERLVRVDGREGARVTTIADLRTNVPVETTSFRLTVPEGYKFERLQDLPLDPKPSPSPKPKKPDYRSLKWHINIPPAMYADDASKLATVYCLAAINPDQVPPFVRANPDAFGSASLKRLAAVFRERAMQSLLRSPSRDDTYERTMRIAGSDPELQRIAADVSNKQYSSTLDLARVAAYVDELAGTIPAMLRNNDAPYKRTNVYQLIKFVENMGALDMLPVPYRVFTFNVSHEMMTNVLRAIR